MRIKKPYYYINVLITPPAQFAIGAARAVAETHQIASNSTRNKCTYTGDSTMTLLREVCDLIFEACEQDHNTHSSRLTEYIDLLVLRKRCIPSHFVKSIHFRLDRTL